MPWGACYQVLRRVRHGDIFQMAAGGVDKNRLQPTFFQERQLERLGAGDEAPGWERSGPGPSMAW